jgi:hypothetical protein
VFEQTEVLPVIAAGCVGNVVHAIAHAVRQVTALIRFIIKAFGCGPKPKVKLIPTLV